MSLWTWAKDKVTGYDRANAQRAESADAQLRALNAQDALLYGPAWAAQVDANYAAQDIGMQTGASPVFETGPVGSSPDYSYQQTPEYQAWTASGQPGGFSVAAQDAAVNQAFVEGAAEGLKATQERWKGWLNGLGLGVLGFIPWWAWLVGAGYLAWKLGAVDWLKRRLAQAS